MSMSKPGQLLSWQVHGLLTIGPAIVIVNWLTTYLCCQTPVLIFTQLILYVIISLFSFVCIRFGLKGEMTAITIQLISKYVFTGISARCCCIVWVYFRHNYTLTACHSQSFGHITHTHRVTINKTLFSFKAKVGKSVKSVINYQKWGLCCCCLLFH